MELYVLLFISGAFLFAGFVKGIIGMGLPPIAIGIMALVLPPNEELLQTLGITFVIAAIALAVLLYETGILRVTNASGSAFALIPTVIGVLVGRTVLKRTDALTLRFYFLLGLLGLGLFIALKAALF